MVQTYEKYWSITLAYSDIHGQNFIGVLRKIRDFIDNNSGQYSEIVYNKLQDSVVEHTRIQRVSVRKAINQFVKLGFVEPYLTRYAPQTNEFLNAVTNKRREAIFSHVVYNNSSFNSSVTAHNDQSGHISFLVKTLEHIGRLEPEDIAALMTVDITDCECVKTQEELDEIRANMKNMEFLLRKYNQLGYLRGILARLEGLVFQNGALYFKDDAERLFPPDAERNGRDMYKHRIFKEELKNESMEKIQSVECMVENIHYPILIASHIKPFRDAEENEQYDPNNGLLLTKSMDALFDQGNISFENDGEIIISSGLPDKTKDHISNLHISDVFLKQERLRYLKYHRDSILKV